jgi:uncharacterized protein
MSDTGSPPRPTARHRNDNEHRVRSHPQRVSSATALRQIMPIPRTVSCPQCGAAVEWTPASKWRPFCSERCKLIDLGAWATESYRIPVAQPSESTGAPASDDDTVQPR